MQHLPLSTLYCISRLNLNCSILPICSQIRWKKKIPCRKPKYLPVAPSKIFRIPEHPYVPPDEKELIEELHEEYYRKTESLRKLFQDELKQNCFNEESILEQRREEEKFEILLEENRKENERIRIIREETLEKEFQENLLELLRLEEEKNKEIEKTKIKIEEIVRMEKAKSAEYITEDNLDAAIERAIDNPVNICFSLDLNGTVKWEGKPPSNYEADIQKRVSEGIQN